LRWSGEVLGVKTGFLQSMFETMHSLRRKGDVQLVVRDGQHGPQHDMIATGGEPHDPPAAAISSGSSVMGKSSITNQPLVQTVRENGLFTAPSR
jgi:hypothetical protein